MTATLPPPKEADTGRRVLFSAQRDEGPYLLEWIAHHKVVGFTDILIVSNDCTDGSDALLDRLAAAGELVHLTHEVPPGKAPQAQAAELVRSQGLLAPGDWVMWLDTDEYLCVHVGQQDVASLIEALPTADAIGVAWRVFGSAGVQIWPGLQLAEPFVRCSERSWGANTQVKTLLRYGPHIARLDIHRPMFSAGIDSRAVRFFGSDGRRLPDSFVGAGKPRHHLDHFLPASNELHRLAQVNHYSVRTPDVYARKALRGRGSVPHQTGAVRHSDAYFTRFDRNDCVNRAILRYQPAVTAEMARLAALLG